MSDNIKTILERAAVLIERGWTQGHSARNSRGEAVEPTSRTACQWCAVGAIECAGLTFKTNQARLARERLADTIRRAAPGTPNDFVITQWNDAPGRTKQGVLDTFKAAIG